MASIYDFALSEASSSTTGGVNTAENQDPSTVNDAMRVWKQITAGLLDDIGGNVTVGGTANAITITIAEGWTALATGMILGFKNTGGPNTTAATIAVTNNAAAALGTKEIRKGNDEALVGGEMVDNGFYLFRYDTALDGGDGGWALLNQGLSDATTAVKGIVELATAAEALAGTSSALAVTPAGLYYPPGHLYGLTLSNNGSDAANDIDIAAGSARDGADTANMVLASALTKRLDAAWAAGTNQGMLDGSESVGGTPDTSTWYHIWLIKRPDTGVVDVLASESATAPTMPTNYTLKRRIGAVYNDSSGDIRAFSQNGDEFLWLVPVADVNAASMGTSAVLRTLTVPTGVKVDAILSVGTQANASEDSRGYISSPDTTDTAATTAGPNVGLLNGDAAATFQLYQQFPKVRTDTSARIRSRFNASSASITLLVWTNGWVDTRGRLA